MKEEEEFLKIAESISEGRKRPFSFTRKDMYGNEKTYSYEGDVFYSWIWQEIKHYTTVSKRTRAYDYVLKYLKNHNFQIHS